MIAAALTLSPNHCEFIGKVTERSEMKQNVQNDSFRMSFNLQCEFKMWEKVSHTVVCCVVFAATPVAAERAGAIRDGDYVGVRGRFRRDSLFSVKGQKGYIKYNFYLYELYHLSKDVDISAIVNADLFEVVSDNLLAV